jgi:hypothetical protein
VPCWSRAVTSGSGERCVNPIAASQPYADFPPSTMERPFATVLNGNETKFFITGSPPEVQIPYRGLIGFPRDPNAESPGGISFGPGP